MQLGDRPVQVGGQRRRAGHAEAHRRQLLDPRVGRQPGPHRRHAEEHRRAGRHRVDHRVRIEAVVEHGARAGDEGAVQADAQAVHVVERQGEHEAVVGLPAPRQAHRLGRGQQVGVGQRDALRRARRARGVHEQGAVVRRRRGRSRRRRRATGGRSSVGSTTTAPGTVSADGPADHRLVADRRHRSGIGGDRPHLALGVRAVDQQRRGPGAQHADVGDDVVHRRGAGHQHPVAGATRRRRAGAGGAAPSARRARRRRSSGGHRRSCGRRARSRRARRSTSRARRRPASGRRRGRACAGSTSPGRWSVHGSSSVIRVRQHVARAGTGGAGAVAGVEQVAGAERQASAADAPGQPVAHPLQHGDLLVEPRLPRGGEPGPVALGRGAVLGQRGHRLADLVELQSRPAGRHG